MPTVVKRIAVIGAGPGGLCSAKYLVQGGHDVTVYEAGSYLGGLWKYDNDNGAAQAYRHLRIITPRSKTRFSDFDFAPGTSRFPSHTEMYRYLSDFADHFGVTERVRFRTRVTAVEPIDGAGPSDPRWRVTYADESGGGSADFHFVLVATGHLNQPSHSELLRSFGGDYVHSSQYRTPAPFVDKRVCVVGTGNSGVDAASGICTVAERTVLVARSGVVIQPKVIFGLAYPDIALGLRQPWIPTWFRMRVVKLLTYIAHGDQSRLGFRKPEGLTHSTMSESIVSHIDFGRVQVKPGIVAINDRKVSFEDGTAEEFDAIVAATGYRVDLPFIDPSIVPVDHNHVALYLRIFSADWPGLCFVGMLNPQTALSAVFEAQSKTILQVVDGTIELPPAAEMKEDIARVREEVARLYTNSQRHALEHADPTQHYTLAAWRREHAIRTANHGQLPRYLRSGLSRRLYAKARGLPVLGV